MGLFYASLCSPPLKHSSWYASGYPVSLPWGCGDHNSVFSIWSQLPGLVPGVSQVHNKCWMSAWPPGHVWKCAEPHRMCARSPGSASACSCTSAVSQSAPVTLCLRCYYYSHYLEEENKVPATEITCSKSHSSRVLKPRVNLGCPPHSIRVTQHRGGSQLSWGSQKMFMDDNDSHVSDYSTPEKGGQKAGEGLVRGTQGVSENCPRGLAHHHCGFRGRESVAETGREIIRIAHLQARFPCKSKSRCPGGSSPAHAFTSHSRREGEEPLEAPPASPCAVMSGR